jgi:hypothetical protein
MGSARPVRRFHALRVLSDRTSGRPKPSGAPPALSRPFRGPLQQPRTVPKALRPSSMLPLLGFLALRHTLGAVDPLHERRLPASPRATSGVWLPPSRRPPPPLPAHEAPERPWASPYKASPAHGGIPLGIPALLTFLPRAPPCGWARRCVRLQGFALGAGIEAGPSRVRPHVLPGLLPSRAFSPVVRAAACSRGAGPPTLQRGNVQSRLGLRALRCDGVGWSVYGLPALLGFCTFRLSRRSVRRPGERAHDFTSPG